MKFTNKWMVVPYVPNQDQRFSDEMGLQLHTALNKQNVHPEEKVKLYNQVLNKNNIAQHPLIPQTININEKTEFDKEDFIDDVSIIKEKRKRKPRGYITPISNSITRAKNRLTRNTRRKENNLQTSTNPNQDSSKNFTTPIKSFTPNQDLSKNLFEDIDENDDEEANKLIQPNIELNKFLKNEVKEEKSREWKPFKP